MSPQNLVDFLMKEQREKATLADAHNIIQKYEPDENGQYLYMKSGCYSMLWWSSVAQSWSVSITSCWFSFFTSNQGLKRK